MSWYTKIKLSGIYAFVCYISHECPANKIRFSVIILVLGLRLRLKTSCSNFSHSLALFPSNLFILFYSFFVLELSFKCSVTLFYTIFFLATFEAFIIWLWTWRLSFWLFHPCHYRLVYFWAYDAFCEVCCLRRCDDLLYLFEVFVAQVQISCSCSFEVVVKSVKGYNKSDVILYCLLISHFWSKSLNQLLDFREDGDGFFPISQAFYDSEVVWKFFENQIDHTLA